MQKSIMYYERQILGIFESVSLFEANVLDN